MQFVTLDEVLLIHDLMLDIAGGKEGIHDFSLLHSAIERPKAQFAGEFLYSNLYKMAASLLQSLVKNHPFNDGNKRTAYFSTLRFLNKNNVVLQPTQTEIVSFMVQVDTENKTLDEIANWLEKNTKRI